MVYVITVEYEGGPDFSFDDRLRKAARRDSVGAGCAMFGNGVRDIQWVFVQRKAAYNAVRRIRTAVKDQREKRFARAKTVLYHE